jgi:hypothetical protein
LEVCKEALEASTLSKNEIYWQSLVIRCAAYATLVYAVESGFWTSTKCLVDYNCYWMKGNWIENPAGFLKFNSYREWTQYFTKKYFQWHYKKLIPDFVYGWSETDRNSYIEYMNTNFWQIYQELENLYFNN